MKTHAKTTNPNNPSRTNIRRNGKVTLGETLPYLADREKTANVIALSEQFPELAVQEITDGRFRLTLANGSASIWVEYYKAENVRDGDDQWRYVHSHSTHNDTFVGPYSHPTERGCWIATRRFLVENDFIKTPQDNSHLTGETTAIVERATAQRVSRGQYPSAGPEVGDVIVDHDGNERRVCTGPSSGSSQTTTAMEYSYYAGGSGHASFSGTCGQSVDHDRLTKGFAVRPALFWTFKDGSAGAGRRVDFWMPVLVWTFDGVFGVGNWGKQS